MRPTIPLKQAQRPKAKLAAAKTAAVVVLVVRLAGAAESLAAAEAVDALQNFSVNDCGI